MFQVLQATTAAQDTINGTVSSEVWTWFDWLALGANLGSVIGLGFTIFAAVRVWRLKNKYDFLLHGRQLARKLSDLEAELLDYLSTDPDPQHQNMKAELKRGTTVLENLMKRLSEDEKSDFSDHQATIRSILDSEELTVDDLWRIYSELNQINERAEDLIRSRTLEA